MIFVVTEAFIKNVPRADAGAWDVVEHKYRDHFGEKPGRL
jgi:hypothetical protein